MSPDLSGFWPPSTWANGQANTLESQRNDTVHTPYILTLDDGAIRFIPYVFGGSQRAKNLHGRDLSVELRSYSANIRSLREFVSGLRNKAPLATDDPSWPERPKLPKPAHAMDRRS